MLISEYMKGQLVSRQSKHACMGLMTAKVPDFFYLLVETMMCSPGPSQIHSIQTYRQH